MRFSSIGDILLTTPLLRAIRTKWRTRGAGSPCSPSGSTSPLVSDNPNVTEVFGIGPQRSGSGSVAAQIRGVRYSHMLDLHGGLRSRCAAAAGPRALVRLLASPGGAGSCSSVFKHNTYQEHVPVAERYFEAAADSGSSPTAGRRTSS